MLTDRAFREHSATASGVLRADVTVEETQVGHVVTVDMDQPTDGVPAPWYPSRGRGTQPVAWGRLLLWT